MKFRYNSGQEHANPNLIPCQSAAGEGRDVGNSDCEKVCLMVSSVWFLLRSRRYSFYDKRTGNPRRDENALQKQITDVGAPAGTEQS